jgi:thiol-disulfide isomerase/thioredoxin
MKIALFVPILWITALRMCAAPFSGTNFTAAAKEATHNNKIVLVDFYTTWCEPCKELDKHTWTDATVIQALDQKTVALRLDAEKEVALAQRYKISAYPTVLLLRADGTEIDRLVGYRPPATFLADFNSALAGKDSIARAQDKLAAVGGEDPQARLQFAVALAQSGKNAEALKEYLWCFDHGLEASPAFTGVRLSFLLSYIKNLSAEYPPALEALKSRRDEREARIGNGSIDRQDVIDLIALNKILGEKERSLTLYDRLPAGSRERLLTARQITPQLLEAKRYNDVLVGVDVSAAFQQRIATLQRALTAMKQDLPSRDILRTTMRRSAVTDGVSYFEALAGLHRNEEAQALKEQILKFDPSAETQGALAEAANRAGNHDLGQSSPL